MVRNETILDEYGTDCRCAVWAVIPAYRRPDLLARALDSLRDQGEKLAGAIVVNNSNDAATDAVCRSSPVPVNVLHPSCNLGTAGGIAFGLRSFLADSTATHAWILDDDATAAPHALETMLATAVRSKADAVAPLLADEHDIVRWVPCALSHRQTRRLRLGLTPAEFREHCTAAPLPWHWSIWASLLVTRRAITRAGLPRLDLWSQFSDIEYTLRITRHYKGVIDPDAVCRHLPPPGGGEMWGKLFSALQNGDYVVTHLPHGWRALRHLPGQNYRYLRHYRWHPRAWLDAIGAFVLGAVLGRPSGVTLHRDEVRRAAEFLASVP